MPPSTLTRREFLGVLGSLSAAALAPQLSAGAEPGPAPRYPLITFTKPFQGVGFDRTAEVVAEAGWSGIECPVRAKGQILPERVEEDLPRLQEALAKKNLSLSLLTTDIVQPNPLAERVLRAAAKLGVQRYRLGYRRYDLTKPIPPQLASWKSELRELAALNRQLGIQGGLQNHSGRDMIGAPLWDLYELVHDIDPASLGVCFDIGHATVEGGLSWPIQARLLQPFFTCVYIKDFAWEKTARSWEPKWGPLGEGLVRRDFLTWLKSTSYAGPISQHCEYLNGATPADLDAMKKDCATLKAWLA